MDSPKITRSETHLVQPPSCTNGHRGLLQCRGQALEVLAAGSAGDFTRLFWWQIWYMFIWVSDKMLGTPNSARWPPKKEKKIDDSQSEASESLLLLWFSLIVREIYELVGSNRQCATSSQGVSSDTGICHSSYGRFHQIPQKRCFVMENPMKMDDLGVSPILGNVHMTLFHHLTS